MTNAWGTLLAEGEGTRPAGGLYARIYRAQQQASAADSAGETVAPPVAAGPVTYTMTTRDGGDKSKQPAAPAPVNPGFQEGVVKPAFGA